MYKLEFKSSTKKDLDKIPLKDLARIRATIISLESNPLPAGTRKIGKIKEPSFRLREGNFRIIYQVDFSDKKVTVISVGRRNESTYK